MKDFPISSSDIMITINSIGDCYSKMSKDPFVAGFDLGAAHRNLYLLLNKLEEFEKEFDDEDTDDEDDEDEEYDDSEYEDLYDTEVKANTELRNQLIIAKAKIVDLKNLIKQLIKEDHIYPGRDRFAVRRLCEVCPEEDEGNLNSRQFTVNKD